MRPLSVSSSAVNPYETIKIPGRLNTGLNLFRNIWKNTSSEYQLFKCVQAQSRPPYLYVWRTVLRLKTSQKCRFNGNDGVGSVLDGRNDSPNQVCIKAKTKLYCILIRILIHNNIQLKLTGCNNIRCLYMNIQIISATTWKKPNKNPNIPTRSSNTTNRFL